MKLPLLFLLIFLMNFIACQWIDPHDLKINDKKKSSIPSGGETTIDSEVYFSHLKRIVGVLINSAHIDKKDPVSYYGNICFTIDPDDLDFLLTFGKGSLSLDKLRKLDTIFSENFKKSLLYEYLDQIESYQTKLYSVVFNIHNLWLFGTIGLLYYLYQLFKSNFSLSYIIKYLLMMVFVCDFVFRYQLLWEAAEQHNASVTYSSHCDSSKMTWSEWTKFILINKNCERKTITPLDVFLYHVKSLVISPMHILKTGSDHFKNIFTTLLWGLNLIMWPLGPIFVINVVVFKMVISAGQHRNQQHEIRALLPDNSENAASINEINSTCSKNALENNANLETNWERIKSAPATVENIQSKYGFADLRSGSVLTLPAPDSTKLLLRSGETYLRKQPHSAMRNVNNNNIIERNTIEQINNLNGTFSTNNVTPTTTSSANKPKHLGSEAGLPQPQQRN